MNKLPMTLIGATALLCGTAALAQTPVAKSTAKTTRVMTKKTTTVSGNPTATPSSRPTPIVHPSPKPSKPLQIRSDSVAAPAATKSTVTTTAPATTTHATTVARSRTTTTTGGRMVQAKLKNGKTVTYDCSKAGNQSKTACK